MPWADLDPDQRNTIFLYAAIAVVVVFAMTLIGYAYYNDRIAPLNDTVLRVGEREFEYSQLERRARYEVRRGTFELTSTIGQAIIGTLRSMEMEELTRQAAARAGITITDADIDNRIRANIGLVEETDRNRFAAFYRQAVLRSGLTTSEYRDIVKAEVARDKLMERFQAAAPTRTDHADMRLIQLSSQSDAIQAKERLDRGDTFLLVAGSMSVHWSRDMGGELGWVPRGALGSDIDDVLFALPPGQASNVIEAPDGFFIVLSEGFEVRDVEADGRAQITQRQLSETIFALRQEIGVRPILTDRQVERVARALLDGELRSGQ